MLFVFQQLKNVIEKRYRKKMIEMKNQKYLCVDFGVSMKQILILTFDEMSCCIACKDFVVKVEVESNVMSNQW